MKKGALEVLFCFFLDNHQSNEEEEKTPNNIAKRNIMKKPPLYPSKKQNKEDTAMKKRFKLMDLDCANCAAKMEDAIKRIEGVNSCTVSFMTQKLTLDAEDIRFDAILQEAIKVCKRIEPDCTVIL